MRLVKIISSDNQEMLIDVDLICCVVQNDYSERIAPVLYSRTGHVPGKETYAEFSDEKYRTITQSTIYVANTKVWLTVKMSVDEVHELIKNTKATSG